MKILVDTGAPQTIVHPGVAAAWKVRELKKELLLTTSIENATEIKGEYDMKLELGGVVFEHCSLVVSITDDIILGLDFMEEHGIKLHLAS